MKPLIFEQESMAARELIRILQEGIFAVITTGSKAELSFETQHPITDKPYRITIAITRDAIAKPKAPKRPRAKGEKK